MRHVKRHREKAAEPDLTPSLDVVFILLIFFIVTATFVEEQTLAVEPPVNDPTNDTVVPAIIVELDSDGLVSVNGRLTDIAFVRANIERQKVQTPEAKLVIQAAATAKSGTLLQVRDAAYGAGFRNGVGVSIVEDES